MDSLRAAVEAYADQLATAGVNVAVDPAQAVLPGAILYPNTVDLDRLAVSDTYEMALDLVVVGRGVGPLDALDQLGELLAKLTPHIGGSAWRAVTVTLPSQAADPLPAFTTTVTVQVTPGEE